VKFIGQILINHPEIALFLALGVGFWIGKFKYKGIGLGSITGTLLAGVAIGALVSVPGVNGAVQTIEISDATKQIFFLLFLFALGVRVGPQFFSGLKGNGRSQTLFAFIMIAIGVATAILMATILGYNPGLAAGLTGGALTQSSIIGVAQNSIAGLNESAETISNWNDLVSVGYAVTYVFGTIGAAFFCANIAPRLLGIKDLPAAARDDAKKLGFEEELPDTISAFNRIVRRAFTVPEAMAGLTMSQLEDQLMSSTGVRLHVDRMRSDGQIVDVGSSAKLKPDDAVVLATERVTMFHVLEEMGFVEINDAKLLDFPIEEIEVFVTDTDVAGKTLQELGQRTEARGIFVKSLTRAGHEMPLLPNITVEHGDQIRIQGPRPLVEAVIPRVGYPERSTPQTDMITVGLGIVIGALVGLPAITVGNIPFRLTSSVGAMVAGLIIGWRRFVTPTFGHIPSGTQWFFESVGLATFIGIVGLDAGPGFVSGLATYGVGLLGAGVVVTLVPFVVGTFLARYVFHFDPVQTLGILAGSLTTTAAVGAIEEASDSSVALLGYTTPYAVGNIFLSVAGAIVVAVMS
jgi:putative transport protein